MNTNEKDLKEKDAPAAGGQGDFVGKRDTCGQRPTSIQSGDTNEVVEDDADRYRDQLYSMLYSTRRGTMTSVQMV